MKNTRKTLLLTAALLAFALGLSADKQISVDRTEKLPPWMGKFFLFVRPPYPVAPGQTPPKIVEPDVAKLGGRLLQSKDNYRVIIIPLDAVKQLRADENVDYVQRIWMGESFENWNVAEFGTRGPRLTTSSDEDGPAWGPKYYQYDGSGNITTLGTDTFRYDQVSRLAQAVVNGVTETYEYDAFGNLTKKQIAGQSASIITVEPSSNRIAALTYDVSGNLTRDERDQHIYDSVGMMVASHGTPAGWRRFYYTADDERIGIHIDNYTIRWRMRDFDGNVLREFRSEGLLSEFESAKWFWIEDWVYAGGMLVGGETAGHWGPLQGGIREDRRRRHYHLDHLGSVRLVTTDARVALGVHHYYPFGVEQTGFNQEEQNFGGLGLIRPEPMRFAGHERDFNGYWNGNNTQYVDYMHARFYDPNRARFLSVDPKLGTPDNPQSWNRYSYALNNPLSFVDPSGMECEEPDDQPCERPEADFDADAEGAILSGFDPNDRYRIEETKQKMKETFLATLNLIYDVVEVVDPGITGTIVRQYLERQYQGEAPKDDSVVLAGLRANLINMSGMDPKDAHAHHVFPQKFRDDFQARGIDIDRAENGVWWEAKEHQSLAHEYNESWEQFLKKNPTRKQIIQRGYYMVKKYRLNLLFKLK